MNGWITIGTKLETKNFDSQIELVKDKMETLQGDIEVMEAKPDLFDANDIQKARAEYEKLHNQLISLNAKQDKINNSQRELARQDLNKFKKNIDSVGDSITKTIKKMGRWALAIFAVESAYGFVRQSINRVSQYNEKVAKDIEYIQFAIAKVMEPVIERIISWVYRLLQYVNLIAQAWFGVNLFANASADAMNKTADNAKKAKKQMAGFDEMNVLSSNQTATSGALPSQDLSEIGNIDAPDWLKWIIKNGDTLLAIFGGISAFILSTKLGIDAIKSLGIGVALAGLLYTIQSIKKYIDSPSWENFGKTLTGIGVVILGLGLIIGNVPLIIAGAIAIIVGLVAKNWDTIKEKLQGAVDWIEGKTDWLRDNLGTFGVWLGQFLVTPIKNILVWFDHLFTGVRQIFDGILKIANGDFKGGLISIFRGLGNIIIGMLNTMINGINFLITPIRELIVQAGKIMGKNWTLDSIIIPNIPKLAKGGIVNNPGRGVPIGGAIAGEVSKEGVIPLTDSQAMEELGSSIGRHVVINATIVNQMNGRTISKEFRRIDANNSFVTNS
jgi:hypothetical protein